tara:strand:+ start:39 stop:713 length:675 start_codon:yes stop_codon:yes gene_type:complete
MDYQVEYDRLFRKIVGVRGMAGNLFTGPLVQKPRFKDQITVRSYKKEFVKTKQYNDKTKKYELWDDRTGSFYNEKETKKYITSEADKRVKKYYLDNYGTETPQQDLKYLQQGIKFQKYANRKNLSIGDVDSWVHGTRYLASRKITGTDQKVFDAKFDKQVAKREDKLDKLRINTSYGKKEREQESVYTPEKHNERVDRLKNLFINDKINQNEANLDLTLTNGTK